GQLQEEAHDLALGPRAVLDAHHHGGQQAFPDAWRREEVGGTDLAQVVQHRGRALWTVDGEAHENRLRVREDVVADPRHRQVRQDLFVGPEVLRDGAVARGHDEVAVRQHRALRRAGGARGVADDRDVGGAALRDFVFDVVWM